MTRIGTVSNLFYNLSNYIELEEISSISYHIQLVFLKIILLCNRNPFHTKR